MYGTIRSAWTLENGSFEWSITIPANTTATVYVPAKDQSDLTENGRLAQSSEGVTFLYMEEGFAVFAVASGSYTFSAVTMQETVQDYD